MLLRKMMSRVGVGSAHVDLILNKSLWRQGEMIQGIVHIYGGTVEQRIERLDVELVQKKSKTARNWMPLSPSFRRPERFRSSRARKRKSRFPTRFRKPFRHRAPAGRTGSSPAFISKTRSIRSTSITCKFCRKNILTAFSKDDMLKAS